MVGPPGLALLKPVVISFPHCAAVKHGGWRLSVLHSTSHPDDPPAWEEMVTLGHETLNSPGYCQIDNNMCHLMTDQVRKISRFSVSLELCDKPMHLLTAAPLLSGRRLHPRRPRRLQDPPVGGVRRSARLLHGLQHARVRAG